MTIFNYAGLFFLLIAQIPVFLRKMNIGKIKLFFIFSISAILFLASYVSYLQYGIWQNNDFSKLFLPPHQSLSYFLFYSLTRFFAPYIISLAFSLLLVFLLKKINKKYNNQFFYDEEIYFGAMAVFLTGYPNFIFYLIAMLLMGVILTALKKGRISLYYFWLPAAIFVIMISKWLTSFPLWQALKI